MGYQDNEDETVLRLLNLLFVPATTNITSCIQIIAVLIPCMSLVLILLSKAS